MTRSGSPFIPQAVGEAFERALQTDPEHEALVATDARLTYAELDTAVDRAAASLSVMGIRRGDIIAVSLPNVASVVVVFYAVQRLGALWLGVNRNLAAQEKQFMLDDAGAALLLADEEVAHGLEQLSSDGGSRSILIVGGERDQWHECVEAAPLSYPRAMSKADDPAAIAYSSGTTGRPKGILHSHRSILTPGAALNEFRGFGPTLRKGDCAAMTILNIQISGTLAAAQAGGTEIIMDRVDSLGIADWIRRERINAWFGVPAQLHGLAHAPEISAEDLATLTDVWTGAAFLPEGIRASFEERFGHRVSMTYGLSEAPNIVTMDDGKELTPPKSSGVPLPHVVVEIRGAENEVLGPGVVGEITVRAATVGPWAGQYSPMIGYLNQPTATQQVLREHTLFTGDLGMLDESGRLYVHERRNALILRGGANVYPAEVERVLMEYPGVRGASVVGIPDERLGQRVAAAIEIEDGTEVDSDALREFCLTQLARYKVPERWRLASLPRNSLGKVVRAEVVAWFVDPDEERRLR